jgi:hypothetical protein
MQQHIFYAFSVHSSNKHSFGGAEYNTAIFVYFISKHKSDGFSSQFKW